MAVLAQLKNEHYGYTLKKELADRGMDIDGGTLYPLLRRLETQGLLSSEWREEDRRICVLWPVIVRRSKSRRLGHGRTPGNP
jgi:DNA-binding PadR family transcriptional regulator